MIEKSGFLPLLLALILVSQASPQGSTAPGLRVFGRMNQTDTHLVDTRGTIVHTWPSAYAPGMGFYVEEGGTLLRAIRLGSGIGAGGGVQRLALDGTVLWEYSYFGPNHLSHHDIEPLPNGNVLLIAWEYKSEAEAVGAGRNPGLISNGIFGPDHIVEVQPTSPNSGTIVWEWHVWDHLIQDFDPTKANYGVVASHPELVDINYPPDPALERSDDWNHANGVDYDPVHDRIVLSAHAQNEIWVIDHSTTTAEAAGHSGGRWGRGGDLLYRWGNPEAYRAGTAGDQMLFGQHAPTFVPPGYPGAGNIVVFNNNLPGSMSAVDELVLPMDPAGHFLMGPNGRYGPSQPCWRYTAPGLFSPVISSAERLANGNTLVCSGAQSWLFELTPSGQLAWEYRLPSGLIFHSHLVERSLWASAASLSASAGGSIALDLLACSARAGYTYLILGSASGTTPGIPLGGLTLPRNLDPCCALSLMSPNAPPLFTRTLGTLDASGNANAAFGLPPALLPIAQPVQLHFACMVIDLSASSFAMASNAVAVEIMP